MQLGWDGMRKIREKTGDWNTHKLHGAGLFTNILSSITPKCR